MSTSDGIKNKLIEKILEDISDYDLTEACEKVGLNIDDVVMAAIEQHLAAKSAAELVGLL